MDNTTLAPADNMTDASNWTWFDVDAFCDSIWNTVGGNNNTSINNPVNSNSSIAICALQETFAASLTTDGDPPLGSTDGATDDGISTTTTAFVLLAAAAMVFFMQTGFAMRSATTSSLEQNQQHLMLMHFVGFCGGAVAFYIMGFAIAFGEGQNGSSGKRFSGNANFALVDFGSGYSEYATFLFHLSLAITASAIVPGVVGDRCKLSGYLWYSVFLVGFVYPIAAHSIWDNNGFLSSTAIDKLKGVGVIDIAGSAVIHITGGLSALMTTMILGSRKGRFYDDDGGMLEEPGDFPINNVVLRILGTLIMWFCWYGVSSGSTSLLDPLGNGVSVGLAAVTVSLSAASGCLVSVFVGSPLDAARTGQNTCDLSMALNGCLSGLVAASAGCAVFEPWVGIIVGTVAGMINYIGSKLLLKFHIDDPIDAIPVHFFNGIWGMLAAGLFAKGELMERTGFSTSHQGLFYEIFRGSFNFNLIIAQLAGLGFVIGWTLVTMTLFPLATAKLGILRLVSVQKKESLDASRHPGADEDLSEDEKVRDVEEPSTSNDNDVAVA